METFNDAVVGFGKFLLRMQSGLQAFTTQPYTEVNSKLGVQYEMSFYIPSLSNGSSYDIIIQTGANPISIKGISLSFDTVLVSTQWFKEPIYTGGTSIPLYNLRDAANRPAVVDMLHSPSTSSTGTAIASKTYTIGSAGIGNRHVSSLSLTLGVERILEADSEYLFRVINEDTQVMRASGTTTWYEGGLDYNP